MIKGISYWSVKGGLENTRPPAEAMDEAKAAGFKALELAVGADGVLTPTTDEATCAKYRKEGDSRGVILESVACGLAWALSPTDNDPAKRKASIEAHAGGLQRTAWLGAKAMLMVPGAIKIPWDASYGPVRYDNALKWAREAIDQLLPVAEKVGVDLCIENVWNGFFYSPTELAQFVDSFKSPRLGVYFDVGNVLGYHQHPPHWIEILGKRIKRIHFKDFKNSIGNLTAFCDLLDGDMPWKETIASLKAIGYDRTVIAEMMPPDDTLLQRTSAAMDKILAM